MADIDLDAIEAQARELEAPTLMVTLADGTSPEDADRIFEAAIEAVYAATDSEVMTLAHLAPALAGDPDILPLVAEVRRLRDENERLRVRGDLSKRTDQLVRRTRALERRAAHLVDETATVEAENRDLRARLDAVLALHQDAGQSQGWTSGGYGYIDHCCGECGSFGEYGEPYPCPTVRAATGQEPR